MNLYASRGGQYPLLQQFAASFSNWVYDSVSGAAVTLGSTPALSTDPTQLNLQGATANTIVFDCVPLPTGAVVESAELIVDTAYVGPTSATVAIGDVTNASAYLAATSLLAVARTAFTIGTGLLENVSGNNIRMTLTYAGGNATAGHFRVRVMYTIDGRQHEVQIT